MPANRPALSEQEIRYLLGRVIERLDWVLGMWVLVRAVQGSARAQITRLTHRAPSSAQVLDRVNRVISLKSRR